MSSGFTWDENIPYTNPANSEIRMILAPDPYRFVLEQAIATPAGQVYNYSGGSTALLGRIVQKVSGQRLEEFARAALFEPLGITDFEWVNMPNGDAAAASGLRLRSRDIAKLGQLFLNRGQWNGKQVISAGWLQEAIAPQIAGSGIYFYGYQWWLGRSLVAQQEIKWAAGVGLGGQRLFIVPERDLVVVVTAGLYQSPMQVWVPLQILNQYVLPAIRSAK
jgi:CubicO group peptidase (beta-lactamase class C family)